MRPTTTLLLVLLVTACDKKADQPATPAPGKPAVPAPAPDAAPPPPAHAKLKVVVDGREVPMKSAVMVRWSDESIILDVASTEISCTEALQQGRVGVPEDDVSFSAHLERRLAKDGTFSWVIANVSSDISFGRDVDRPTTVTGDLAAGPEIGIDLDLEASANSSGRWKRISVHGLVTPTPCGDRPIAPDHPALAKAKHPSDATITVAGQKVAVVSAWRHEKTIYLSTEPITCSYSGLPTRVSLALDRYDDKDGAQYRMDGAWIPLLGGGGKQLQVKPGKTGDGPDGPTVELALSGAADLEGYKVEIAGTIEALDCRERY